MVALQQEHIYGLRFIEESDGERLRWLLQIDHPFQLADGRLRFGVNERALREAMARGVEKFMLGDKFIFVPDERELKRKVKAKEFEWKPSIFAGREDYRIFYFLV